MPKILTYNSPSGFEKKLPKGNIFKGSREWFSSQEKYTKFFILTALLIIVATPFVVNNLLETRQRAEGPGQQLTAQQAQDLAKLNNAQVLGPDEFAVVRHELNNPSQNTSGKKMSKVFNLSNGGTFTYETDKAETISLIQGNDQGTAMVPNGDNTTVYQKDDYLPQDAKAKIDPGVSKKLGRKETVKTIIEFNLPNKFYETGDSDEKVKEKKAKFDDTKGKVAALFKGKGKLKNDLQIINGVSADLDKETLAALSTSSLVKRVELDKTVKVFLNESVPEIQADSVWNLTDINGLPITGTGERIAIIDTGVDYTHPDLGGCLGANCKVIGGHDFVHNDNDPMDDYGHGTHVAATAAGKGFAADGTRLFGVAPDAKILAYKVCDSGGSCYSSNIISAIGYTTDPNQDGNSSDHADVGSMSLGGPGNPDDELSIAVDNSTAAGVVYTIAAGNSGPAASTIGSPGTARTAITVAAACKASQIGKNNYCTPGPIASFSSRGPVIWNGVDIQKPDVAAPGVYICAAEWGNWLSAGRCKDTTHIAISGTSMATPHVAGAVALIRQANPGLPPSQVKQLLKTTARNLGVNYNDQGAGEINVFGAIPAGSKGTATPSYWNVTSDPTVKTSTSKQSFSVKVNDSSIQTLDVGFKNLDIPGITITPSTTALSVASGSAATFDVTVAVDNDTAKSNTSFGSVTLSSGGVIKVSIPVFITVKPTLEVSPLATIDYGADNPSLANWTSSTQTVTVKNLRTDTAQNITVTPGTFATGINFQVNPSTFSVPASGSSTFSTNFVVDNSQVPNGYYNSSFTVNSQTSTIRVNTSFVKFYVLKIYDPVAGELASTWFLLNDRTANKYFVVSNGTNLQSIYLNNPGTYDLIAELFPQVVFKEGINVDGSTTVTVQRAEATHKVQLKPTDINGYAFHINSAGEDFYYVPKPTVFSFGQSSFTTLGYDLPPYYFSNVSSNYKFSQLEASPMISGMYAFLLTFTGLQNDFIKTNTPSDLKKINVNLDPDRQSGTFRPVWYNVCSDEWYLTLNFFDFVDLCSGGGLNSWETLNLPFHSAIYSTAPSTYVYKFSGYVDNKLDTSPWFTMETPPKRWWLGPPESVWAGITTPFYIPPAENNTQYVGLGPTYFAGRFNNDAGTVGGRVIGIYDYFKSAGLSLFPRQDYSYRNYGTVPFTISQNGSQVASGSINLNNALNENYPNGSVVVPYGADQFNMQFSYIDNGTAMTGKVTANFDTSKIDSNPPTIKRLYYYANNFRSEVYDPKVANRLEFEVDPVIGSSSAPNSDSISSVGVSYSTDGTNFTPVTVNTVNGAYSVDIPSVSGTKLTLKITAADNSQNDISQTIELPFGTAPSPLPTPTPTSAPSPAPTQPGGGTSNLNVSLTQPSNGAVIPVGKTIVLTASATDDPGVNITKVEFYVNGSRKCSDNNTPYVCNFRVPTTVGGIYTITAKAYDITGNTKVSLPSNVTGGTDTVYPSVTLTSPLNGARVAVSFNIVISATATDTVGVSKVEFYVNGSRKCSDTTAPYSCSWTVPAGTGISYSLNARAYDAANNISNSTIAVTSQ